MLIHTEKNSISTLTTGTNESFSGNPLKALRFKRKQQFIKQGKTKEGKTMIQEKNIMELMEEFQIGGERQDSDYSPNVSVDSFEIDNYREDIEEDQPFSRPKKPVIEFPLPLLEEEKYILGSDIDSQEELQPQFEEEKKEEEKVDSTGFLPNQMYEPSPIPMRKFGTGQKIPFLNMQMVHNPNAK